MALLPLFFSLSEVMDGVRKYTDEIRAEVDSEFCFYCGKRLKENNKTFDHLIPVAQGGKDVSDNLVCCCLDCNTVKGNNTIPQLLIELNKQLKWCGDDLRRKAKLEYYIKIFSVAAEKI